ncbi:MAG TPA: FABP family protein [Candidatus Dormibacteraeota bacterium]|nr:FABP family protein [Candidatus Dormibacteraeota bacterium]
MTAPALHPDLAPLAMLLGEWAGEGRGRWGEGAPFAYREEVAFRHSGKPVLAYTQRTVALDDGRPMHSEMGFWRPAPEGAVEVTLAHPTGFVEIELGTVDGGIVRLATACVERTPTAKVVTRLEREFDVDGDRLHYVVRMATDGGAARWHLEATLHLRPAPGR